MTASQVYSTAISDQAVVGYLVLSVPAIAWAAIPLAFTPFSNGPLVQVGWQAEFVWLPASTKMCS